MAVCSGWLVRWLAGGLAGGFAVWLCFNASLLGHDLPGLADALAGWVIGWWVRCLALLGIASLFARTVGRGRLKEGGQERKASIA